MRKETAILKCFDSEDIKEAGHMPIPTIPNPISERLLKTLQGKLGFTEQQAFYWEFMLWRLVQDEDAKMPGIFQMLMDAGAKSNKLKDINDANATLQVVMEFLNHSPRWIFRGRCPDDLQKSAPPIRSAPQLWGPTCSAWAISKRTSNGKWMTFGTKRQSVTVLTPLYLILHHQR